MSVQDSSNRSGRKLRGHVGSCLAARPFQLSKTGRSARAKHAVVLAEAEAAEGAATQTQSGKTVSILGIGLMGNKMARRLSEQGFQVTTWNRTPSKADALAEVRKASQVGDLEVVYKLLTFQPFACCVSKMSMMTGGCHQLRVFDGECIPMLQCCCFICI